MSVDARSNAALDRLGQEFQQFRKTLDGGIDFHPDLAVPRSTSRFGDDTWVLTDSENPKHLTTPANNRTIVWRRPDSPNGSAGHPIKQYDWELGDYLLEDVKRLFWMCLAGVIPTLQRRGGKGSLASTTVVTLAKQLQYLLGWIAIRGMERNRPVFTLADLTTDHLLDGMGTCPYALSGVQRPITFLADEVVQSHVVYPATLTLYAIQSLPWKRLIKENRRNRDKLGLSRAAKGISNADQDGHLPLHPRMFCHLSHSTRAHVRDALEAFGLPVEDLSPNPEYERMERAGLLLQQRVPKSQEEWRKGKRRAPELSRGIENARLAAHVQVLMYTGMRTSEAALIRVPADRPVLVAENGHHFILSTVVKRRPDDHVLDTDRWIAIDSVRDAVRLLEALARRDGASYLLRRSRGRGSKKTGDTPLTSDVLGSQIYRYIADNDSDGTFVQVLRVGEGAKRRTSYHWTEGIPPHPNRFRESLAFELARAGCGLPFITKQLHHVHTRFWTVNQTTLGYGMQGKLQQSLIAGAAPPRAEHLGSNPGLVPAISAKVVQARAEIFQALLGPGSRCAGGNAEQHQARTEAYFVGKARDRDTVAKLARRLAREGAPLTVCGYGLCGRPYDEDEPVCTGDICPADCANHLVPPTAAPTVMRRWAHSARQLERREQSHMRSLWQRTKDEYEAQLHMLGVDVKSLEITRIEDEVTNLVIRAREEVYGGEED